VLRAAETRNKLLDILTQMCWMLDGPLIAREKERGTPRKIPLSWLLKIKEGNMDYTQLKELAQYRSN